MFSSVGAAQGAHLIPLEKKRSLSQGVTLSTPWGTASLEPFETPKKGAVRCTQARITYSAPNLERIPWIGGVTFRILDEGGRFYGTAQLPRADARFEGVVPMQVCGRPASGDQEPYQGSYQLPVRGNTLYKFSVSTNYVDVAAGERRPLVVSSVFRTGIQQVAPEPKRQRSFTAVAPWGTVTVPSIAHPCRTNNPVIPFEIDFAGWGDALAVSASIFAMGTYDFGFASDGFRSPLFDGNNFRFTDVVDYSLSPLQLGMNSLDMDVRLTRDTCAALSQTKSNRFFLIATRTTPGGDNPSQVNRQKKETVIVPFRFS